MTTVATGSPYVPGSRAILIGTSSHQDPGFHAIPAALNSLDGMRRMLTDPALGGWPASRLTVMTDPDNAGRVATEVRRLVRDVPPSGTLLLYYVGHGRLTIGGRLCLTMTDTVYDAPEYTGVSYAWVAQAMRESPARVKITILDCCYSGNATGAMAGDSDSGLTDLTHVDGVYTLTATARNETAHVPALPQQNVQPTSFTGQLLDLIRGGVPDGPEHLAFLHLYPLLQQRLAARGLPRPQQSGTGTVERYPFARNAAWAGPVEAPGESAPGPAEPGPAVADAAARDAAARDAGARDAAAGEVGAREAEALVTTVRPPVPPAPAPASAPRPVLVREGGSTAPGTSGPSGRTQPTERRRTAQQLLQSLGIRRRPPATVGAVGLSTLPPTSAVFAGRQGELDRLAALPHQQAHRAAVFLITGASGAGKTELAVQAAHRMAHRFPDGRMFLAFRSNGGESSRLEVRDVQFDALSRLAPDLPATAFDPDRLLSSWRAATTGKRILLVVDDVVSADQVLGLLPSSLGCLVLATSRRFVPGIDPDVHCELDGLSPDEAQDMITGIAMRASHPVDPAVVRELASVYRLPLTIRHAVDQLVSGVQTEQAGTMTTPRDEADVFKQSFSRLAPRTRLVLRRVALYPGPHITGVFAAALADVSVAEAEAALKELHNLSLLNKPDPHGYGMHDFVRDLARADGAEHGDGPEQDAALARLFREGLDFAAELAAAIRAPVITSWAAARTSAIRTLESEATGTALAAVYFADLRAIIRLAVDRSWSDAWALVSEVSYYLRVHRNVAQAEEFNEAALRIALAGGNRLGQAVCHLQGARLARLQSNHDTARSHARRALTLFAEVDDVLGQATGYTELATLDYHLAAYEASTAQAELAERLYLRLGDVQGRANIQGLLGMVGRLSGDYAAALEHLGIALDLFTRIGSERNQAWIQIETGTILRQTGQVEEARNRFRLARGISDRAGDRSGRAWADRELGIVARMSGDHDGALVLLTEALGVFTELGGRRNMADAHVELGTLHRISGADGEARAHLDEALAIYTDIENGRGRAWTELELGALERAAGSLDAAQSHYEKAAQAYAVIRDRSGAARTQAELGCLAAARGRRQRAREHWQAALDLYLAMDSPASAEVLGWLDA